MARTDIWTETDIPNQSGRTVLVTGANSGLGLHTARVLAARGATVLLACRSPERGKQALATIAAGAATEPQLVELDLADLASVRRAAADVRDRTGDGLDILVNNAGVMAPPHETTRDGFELQFGTNHLGHAALTWLLLPALRARQHARVVTVSSLAARAGRIDTADPHFEHRRYNPVAAYGQSKLANQAFALELDRRLRAAGDDVVSVAAHPGYSDTGLAPAMARAQRNGVLRTVMNVGGRLGGLLLAQNTEQGAAPQLYAATAPGVSGGDYFGPLGPGQMRGRPGTVRPLATATDQAAGTALWELTAELTGVTPDPA
ncbi:NAD(P)-dependent dehydrogenase (short-subunit alcohol dehydrogenase family) [Prauserella sediminis]|uniref:NAD(P)-dependent dehydrogenase (Short-subunit alcohol dehydrogenase family) n=1 Tax=Prauserella sediminis TaxID=577680 RepID=A0A839XD89_9PSEU|nr:oxidoreductase [Prauserella sediminis]MBB3661240.1 NAD(P)-dependent dehydrogenase (short-subunit alcohol dehydrogenase family) [Prauserella sediminis]